MNSETNNPLSAQSQDSLEQWEQPVVIELNVNNSKTFKFFTTKLDADGGPLTS